MPGLSLEFETKQVPIEALDVRLKKGEKHKPGSNKALLATTVGIDGVEHKSSLRFWTSLSAQFGLSTNVYNYFGYDEVFERIRKIRGGFKARVTVEKSGTSRRLLALTDPNKPMATYDELQEIFRSEKSQKIEYDKDGSLISRHRLAQEGGLLSIAGDSFQPRIAVVAPVDGYGKPSIYLELLRIACSNLGTVMAAAFRSEISLGKNNRDVGDAVERSIHSYNNDEGFAAIAARMEAAAKSWASVYETMHLGKVLRRFLPAAAKDILAASIADAGPDAGRYQRGNEQIHAKFKELTGSFAEIYGITQLEALSERKARTLPTKATVGQLIQFATEAVTHHAGVEARRGVFAWFGSTLSGEFDLENSVTQMPKFADFFLPKPEMGRVDL